MLARVRDRGPFATATTDGFRFIVRAVSRTNGAVVGSLPFGGTYRWPTWEAPVSHEQLKPAYYALQALWGSW